MKWLVISSFCGTVEAKTDDYEITPMSNPTDIRISSEYIATGTIEGLVETTPNNPNWVLVTSDTILRENVCNASWYDRVFNPCYYGYPHYDTRFWKLESGTNVGKAFPMGDMGPDTFDGLYVRKGFGFQLYYNTEEPSDPCDLEPASPYMWGPQYVSIDFWWELAPDGFEPNTFFVSGGPGALSNHSIIINRNILGISKTDDVNDGGCVVPGDEITYTIDYKYHNKMDYFGYEGLADFHEWWLCVRDFNNNDCNGMDENKDGIVNFIDFALLAGNWLKGQFNDVNIIDYLPVEADFVSASAGGVYDCNSHTVRWEIGTLEPEDFGSVTLTVLVNEFAEPNSAITNECEIKSGDEVLTTACEYTRVGYASWWKFNEGSGTIAYDSAGSNNGTLVNGPVWTSGQIDGALSFDGTNDYVNMGDPADGSLDFGASDSFTISLWFKRDIIGVNHTLICKREVINGTHNEGYLWSISNDNLSAGIEGTNTIGTGITGSTTIGANQWYHAVFVRDAATDKLYLYLNGVSDAAPVTDTTTATLANTYNFMVGRWEYYNFYFDGSIDDVRIYKRALSAEEIEQLYQDGL